MEEAYAKHTNENGEKLYLISMRKVKLLVKFKDKCAYIFV